MYCLSINHVKSVLFSCLYRAAVFDPCTAKTARSGRLFMKACWSKALILILHCCWNSWGRRSLQPKKRWRQQGLKVLLSSKETTGACCSSAGLFISFIYISLVGWRSSNSSTSRWKRAQSLGPRFLQYVVILMVPSELHSG